MADLWDNPLVGYAVDRNGNPLAGLDTTGAMAAGYGGTLSGWSGDRFPNIATISDYLGVNPSLAQVAMSAIPGPVGMGLSALNSVGNAVNTSKNSDLLASLGAPLGIGQMIGGVLGGNGYNGTATSAINAAQSSMNTSPMGHLGLDVAGFGSSGDFSSLEKAAGTVNGINAGTNPTGSGTAGVQGLGGTMGDITGGGFGGDMGANSAGTDHAEDGGAQADGFARGGLVPGDKRGGMAGAVRSSTGGRADGVSAHLPGGAFVLPAAVVAALGGGNSDAGLKRLAAMFPAKAGNPLSGQAARVSGGEFIVAPQYVAALGGPGALEKMTQEVMAQAGGQMQEQARQP